MTQFLPPNLLALFAPRDPIPYLPPASKLPHEKKTRGYVGVGAFLENFEVSNNSTNLSLFQTNIISILRILKIRHHPPELKRARRDWKGDVEKGQNKSLIN